MKTKREKIETYKKRIMNDADKKIRTFIETQFPSITEFKEIGFAKAWVSEYDRVEFKVDGKKVKLGVDKYNNVTLYECDRLTLADLESVHELLLQHLEKQDSYKHRTGTSFLVNYYEEYKPNKNFVKEMITLNHPIEKDMDGGFKGWLTGHKDELPVFIKELLEAYKVVEKI